MPFKNGAFKHKDGFILYIFGDNVAIGGEIPLTVRISDLINVKNWEEINNGSQDTNGDTGQS